MQIAKASFFDSLDFGKHIKSFRIISDFKCLNGVYELQAELYKIGIIAMTKKEYKRYLQTRSH